MESIPKDLQDVAMPEGEVKRAVAMAKPTNEKVRDAAGARLKFEDEPGHYTAFLNDRT